MQEITSGTREISSGMTDLNEITRRTSDQIAELSEAVQRFTLPKEYTHAEEDAEAEVSIPMGADKGYGHQDETAWRHASSMVQS
jgi:hypothetical protein